MPASLRWRLTMWVAGVMLIAAAVIFVVIYEDAGAELRNQINRGIASDTSQISRLLGSLDDQHPTQIAAVAQRYVRAQPYTANSTLLFVLVPGEAAVSNHPEVFAAIGPEEGETVLEQARENALGVKLLTPRIGYSTHQVPDVGAMRIHERAVRVGQLTAVVGAGDPLAVVEQAQHGVARAFALAGAVTLAIALLASYLAGARVSAPLRRMAGVATRVDAGELDPRMEITSPEGSEVRVLAEAFNHMLDRLAAAFDSQRAFVADASHELRTPLTVMRGQLDVLVAQEAPSDAEVRRVERLVQAEISRISRLVDDLLVLVAAEQTNFLCSQPIQLHRFVAELWDGVSLIAERRFELGPVPSGVLRADPERLTQALRNLARNAIEHTTAEQGLVRLQIDQVGSEQIRFSVIDDGPGIPVSDHQRVFERFHRTDPGRARTAGGTGLGLAIVKAIAEAHGGHVRAADPGDAQGARVELLLPGFMPG
ncbi:MAG: ATP-binding protein [Solirubrobacteraceae bacterium]